MVNKLLQLWLLMHKEDAQVAREEAGKARVARVARAATPPRQLHLQLHRRRQSRLKLLRPPTPPQRFLIRTLYMPLQLRAEVQQLREDVSVRLHLTLLSLTLCTLLRLQLAKLHFGIQPFVLM